jgi:thiol:disulfide interchange protein DsbD
VPVLILCGLVLLLACSLPVNAGEDEAATDQVKVRLVASVDAVRPGADIWVGVQQRIIPHWHTYWINPGDSGLATTIEWSLPAGATAGEIRWPVPNKTTVGPVTNYAYQDEVTLVSSVKAPESLVPGQAFPIHALVKWLVCDDICIPQQAELSLTLPVVDSHADIGAGSPAVASARSRWPAPSPWPARFQYGDDGLLLRVDTTDLSASRIRSIDFFPDQWGRITHNTPPTVHFDAQGVTLKFAAGESPVESNGLLTGVLAVQGRDGEAVFPAGYSLTARSGPVAEPAIGSDVSLATAFGLALLGGLILNLMPCVFPVLSLKALHLVRQTEQPAQVARRHGWAYTLGVLASFGFLGGLLAVLKAGGQAVGWGFQFQSPMFVVAAAYLTFAVGLNLSGVFTIPSWFAGLGSSLADRAGYAGSFFTGVLASLVAAPCTAPFMGIAIGYAVTQPALLLIAILLALGLGLAAPYLVLSHWPLLQRWLPRPGAWMDVLKQALAFPMYATSAWLVWVLAQQCGPNAAGFVLSGLVAIAFAAWLFEHRHVGWDRLGQLLEDGLVALVLALAIGTAAYGVKSLNASAVPAAAAKELKNWEPYSAERLRALRARGEPVFLNFTAAWCISCLVNERVALSQAVVEGAFRAGGITYLKGDWTHHDEAIAAKLAEFGRSGVPLYVFYPAGVGSAPVVLPQILTPAIVLGAIRPDSASVNTDLSMNLL